MDLFEDLLSNSEPEIEELLADRITGQGCSVKLHRKIFSGEESTRLFRELFEEVEWEQREVTVYGKKHLQPRLVAWFGNNTVLRFPHVRS